MEKEQIRNRVRAIKEMLSESERLSAADEVFKKIEELAAFMMSDRILMYHSLPDELSTHKFLEKWSGRKQFFLPRVNGVNLEILPFDKSRLHIGAFHIEEPDGEDTIKADDIEMIVVPAVAYDEKGNRVGRGKGYYDRLLTKSKATKVGVGYDFQIVEEIESESHDIKMDIIVTESRVIFTRKKH